MSTEWVNSYPGDTRNFTCYIGHWTGLFTRLVIFKSLYTDPVFSRHNANVVCLSDIAQYWKFCQHIEWRLKKRPFRIIWTRSTAFLGRAPPRACRGNLLTQSSFGVERVKQQTMQCKCLFLSLTFIYLNCPMATGCRLLSTFRQFWCHFWEKIFKWKL